MENLKLKKPGLPSLYLFVVFCMTFYAVYFWSFGPLLKYGAMVIGVFFPFFIDKKFFQSKEFVCFVLYFMLIYMNHLIGNENYSRTRLIYINSCSLFIALSMTHYLINVKNIVLFRRIVLTTIVVLVWTAIVTGIIDSTMPGIVRYAVQSINQDANVSEFAGLYRMGMSNYLLPHALPIMIPPFVMVLRTGNLSRIQSIICYAIIFALLALLYFSGATGPLLLGVFVLVLSFIARPGRMSSNIIKVVITVLLVVPFLMNDDLMLSLFNWLDDLVGNEGHFHSKIMAMQNGITMGEAQGDFAERGDLYQSGWESIIENPFFGSQKQVAGHSIIMSVFATMGIIGFVPFISMLIFHVQSVMKHIPDNVRVYYYIGLLAAFLMFAMKGIESWEIWFASMTFLPISILWFSSIKVNKAKQRII